MDMLRVLLALLALSTIIDGSLATPTTLKTQVCNIVDNFLGCDPVIVEIPSQYNLNTLLHSTQCQENLNDLTQELSSAQSHVTYLERMLGDATSRVKLRQAKILEKDSKIEELTRLIQGYYGLVNDRDETIRKLKEENALLEQSLQVSQTTLEKTQDQVLELEKVQVELEEQVSQLIAKGREEESLANFKTSLYFTIKFLFFCIFALAGLVSAIRERQEIQRRLKELETEKKDKTKRIKELKRNHKSRNKTIQDEHNREKSSLNDRITTLGSEKDQLQNAVTIISAKNETLNKEYDTLNEQSFTLLSISYATEATIVAQEEKIKELRRRALKRHNRIRLLQYDISHRDRNLDVRIQSLRKKVLDAQEFLPGWINECKKKSEEITQLKQEARRDEEKVDLLEARVMSVEEEKKNTLKQIGKMISENLTLELERQEEDKVRAVKLLREREESDRRIKGLEESLEKEIRFKEELSLQVQETQKAVSKLEESFKGQQFESLKKCIKLLETQKLFITLLGSVKSKLEKETHEVANLRREKGAIESEFRKMKEEKEKVSAETRALRRTLQVFHQISIPKHEG